MGSAAEELGQNREALLRPRGRRRALAQEGADRLGRGVEARPQMHPALMHFKQAQLTRREACVGTDLDVVAAGGGVGHDAIG